MLLGFMDEPEISKDMGVSNYYKLRCFGGCTLKRQYLKHTN